MAPRKHEDEDEDEDEPAWADEAEAAAPDRGDGEDDPLLTAVPGVGAFNPIFGGGGVGAFEGQEPAPRLEGRLPGETLLVVRGRRPGPLSLTALVLAGALLLGGGCLALGASPDLSSLPWPTLHSSSHSWLLWAAAALVLGLALALRTWLGHAEVVFTSEGVARRGAGADAWTPWSQVRGYQVGADGLVVLETHEGTILVATADEEQLGATLALLDRRAVPRST